MDLFYGLGAQLYAMIRTAGALDTFLIFLVESSNNIMLMFNTTKFIKDLLVILPELL